MNGPSPSEQRRLALAEAIAASWAERSIPYAIVHGLERYPVCIGRDLDAAMARESVPGAGRFLKSCVRPLLCGDLSRVEAGREWSLPVAPPHPIESEQLEELLGRGGGSAL